MPLGGSQSARELRASRSPTRRTKASGEVFRVWGQGPRTAGSTRWRRDQRLEARSRIFEAEELPATQFRRMYDRGDLPISVVHGAVKSIGWKVKVENLDYHHYLPVFIDGLREKTEPYGFIAMMGMRDLIARGEVVPEGSSQCKLLPVVPQLIIPLKTALATRDPATVVRALECILLLTKNPKNGVGRALVPYYRQLLPVLNIYKAKKRNLGDQTDFAQMKRDFRTIGEMIEETLNALERSGGQNSFINIKYMVPTYESCLGAK